MMRQIFKTMIREIYRIERALQKRSPSICYPVILENLINAIFLRYPTNNSLNLDSCFISALTFVYCWIPWLFTKTCYFPQNAPCHSPSGLIPVVACSLTSKPPLSLRYSTISYLPWKPDRSHRVQFQIFMRIGVA